MPRYRLTTLVILCLTLFGSNLLADACVTTWGNEGDNNEHVPFPLSLWSVRSQYLFNPYDLNLKMNAPKQDETQFEPSEFYVSRFKLTRADNCYLIYKAGGTMQINRLNYEVKEALFFPKDKSIILSANHTKNPLKRVEIQMQPCIYDDHAFHGKLTFYHTSIPFEQKAERPSYLVDRVVFLLLKER